MENLGRRAAIMLGAASGAAFARDAAAQAVNRTARTIVGFPAGGSSDIVARLYAERLRGTYAPQVVVESRSGAAGRIAVEAVKAADPDGTTWLQTPASMLTLQPHIFPREVRYDALTDFIPISTVVTFPFAFAVPMNHPARTLEQWATWARAQSGDVPWASPAAGAAPHFMGLQFARALNLRMTHVSYRGAVPAVQDVIAGRIAAFIGVLGDVSPQNGTGLRLLAVSSAQRNPRFPDVPTFAEQGRADMTKDEWFGVLLPLGTPAPIVAAFHQAIVQASQHPELRAAMERLEFSPTVSARPADFAALIRRERDEYGPIVRDSGFQPES